MATPAKGLEFRTPPIVQLLGSSSWESEQGDVKSAVASGAAAARTCYSPRIITVDDTLGPKEQAPDQEEEKRERRIKLGRDLLHAGHLTTLQHHNFTFSLKGISRHVLWQFLHTHPFYNSEQASQRYVKNQFSYAIPRFDDLRAQAFFEHTLHRIEKVENDLTTALLPFAKEEYARRFPKRYTASALADPEKQKEFEKQVQRKAQEVARYLRPVAAHAHLYHTINAVTLLRLFKASEMLGAPSEQKAVLDAMVQLAVAQDPDFFEIMPGRTPIEETGEYQAIREQAERLAIQTSDDPEAYVRDPAVIARIHEHRQRFDASLEGRISKLVSEPGRNERIIADAVHEALALPYGTLTDGAAIAYAMDSSKNAALAAQPKTATNSPLARAMMLASYAFRKRLSHTADSQDQRHRMVGGPRPILMLEVGTDPDYVTPALVTHASAEEPAIGTLYESGISLLTDAMQQLLRMGSPAEAVQYLFPNAKAIRFTQAGDVLNLQHKLEMRLCLNAQEEIFRASLDEMEQVAEANPFIGLYLQPPCGHRAHAGQKPPCPEGPRYCGIPVWKMERNDFVQLKMTRTI